MFCIINSEMKKEKVKAHIRRVKDLGISLEGIECKWFSKVGGSNVEKEKVENP